VTATADGERHPDRTRIDLGRKQDVTYWTRTLGLSRVELADIIRQVGHTVAAVRREVRK
jgi:hypothetical protein